MNTAPLRWGILGTANIARKNWQAIHNTGNSVLVAVASRDLTRCERFIAECQADVPLPEVPKACASYDALLASPEVDAVYIPLPTGIRRDWVLRAAAAGKHVVCEKPCAVTLADLVEMTDACRHHGVQFMDGVMFVHSERHRRIRELLAAGATVGTVRRINTQFSFLGDERFFADNMRVFPELEPHGCLGDLGWYSIVFTLEAMEGRMPQEVVGRIHSTFGRGTGDSSVPAEFSGELRYSDGMTSSFYCSFLNENQQWADISGTGGRIHISDFVLPFSGSETAFETSRPEFDVRCCQFEMRPNASRVAIPEFSNNHPTAQETNLFRHFAARVISGVLDNGWPTRALKTQRLLDACLESARNQSRPVAIG